MQKIFNKLVWIMAGACFILASCTKQETRATLIPGQAPVFSASAATVVLDSTKDTDEAVNFTWTKINYGYNADVTYTLQFDTPEDSFKNAVNVVLPLNTLSHSYTVRDFNALAFQSLGLAANTAGQVSVRVMADIKQNGAITGPSSVPTIYSNAFGMEVTPYQIVIVYPTLYVPGDYQGWNPATAPTIASVQSNGVYEGYVYIPAGGTYQFKYTPAPNWNTSYGDGGGDGPIAGAAAASVQGSLSGSGGNLQVPAGGYYRLTADLNQNTWSALSTTWSVIGDATPGGWDTDTPLTFDPSTGAWSATTNLVSTGTFKFRANNDWGVNFGVDNDKLDYGGSNIPVPANGKYTITLNLSTAGNYTYNLKKQD